MSYILNLLLVALRIAMGLMILLAGLEKVTPRGQWSAGEFLANSNWIFGRFYRRLAGKRWVDFLNAWGLTLGGLAIFFGAFVKIAGFASAFLMLMYYFAYKPKSIFYVVKDTLIYAIVLVLLAVSGAGYFWGLDKYLVMFLPWRLALLLL